MDKALGVIGQVLLLQTVVELILVITEENTVQTNVAKIAGNHPKSCTYVLDVHPFNPRIAMSAGYDGKIIVWDESWQQQEQHQLLAQSWIKFTGDLVTVSPDVFQVDLGVDEEFVLLASDGLWDYMNSSEAVSFVREQLRKHGDAQMACEALGQVALDVDVEDEHDEDSGDSNEDGDS